MTYAVAEVRYPSLIGELEDANVGGGQPWLFYSREPPNGTWPQAELTVGLINPGLSGNVDVYAGFLSPDNSIHFLTSTGIVVSNPSHLASFPPLATGVPLEAPFSLTVPDFYAHTWTGNELRGTWVFLFAVVNAGALAGGTLPEASIVGLSSASFSFPSTGL